MKSTEDHDLIVGRKVLLQEPFKHPKNSKERGDVWGQMALNLNSRASPIFKVSKRSVRLRLTLLQTKYREKIREEERDPGIDCEETQLDAAVEEILDKENAADMERNEQAGTLTKKKQKHQSEKARAEEVWRQAMERLGKTQERNADSEERKSSKRGKKRSSDAVEYLKEKFELKSKLRKGEMEFKKNEQQMLMDQQSQMHKHQLEMMKMVQQQNHSLMALLEKATFTK